jgi:hypothetical protein
MWEKRLIDWDLTRRNAKERIVIHAMNFSPGWLAGCHINFIG